MLVSGLVLDLLAVASLALLVAVAVFGRPSDEEDVW